MRFFHGFNDCVVFFLFCLIYCVFEIFSLNRTVGRDLYNVHSVNITELFFLSQGSTCHTALLLILVEQVLEQAALLEETYKKKAGRKQEFSVSTQHYSFAVNAFVELIERYGSEKYDFCLRETQTYEIIEDVAQMKSEIGILYLNDFNRTVLEKLIKEHDLVFTELFVAKPHIFVSTKNPLAGKKSVTIEELEPYPYLSFEQGEHNSFYFSEEIFSTVDRPKNIRVRDRATLFNLLIGLNGYTVCSGVIDEELNGENIVSVPLQAQGDMHIGMVTHKKVLPSRLGAIYREALVRYTQQKI